MIRQTLCLLILTTILTGSWLGVSAFSTIREEYGKCGYYSDALQGRKTASGEKYDKNLLTCAHKSLPFGTLLRVTRLDSKQSVVVRVNDRGPYRSGYIVDISRRAAEELDIIKAGSVKVKIDVIDKPVEEAPGAKTPATTSAADARPVQYGTASTARATPAPASTATKSATTAAATRKPAATPAATTAAAAAGNNSPQLFQIDLKQPPKTGFGVQVTTLYNAPNVFPEVMKLMKYWPGKVLVSTQPMPEATENTIYKLILGPVADKASAEKLRKEAAKRGYAKCFVVDLSQM